MRLGKETRMLVNKALAPSGFVVVRRAEAPLVTSRSIYKRHYKFLSVEYDFWIFDETGRQWYDHDFWKNAPEFQLLESMVTPESRILEIGLHHGFTAVFLAKHLDAGAGGRYYGMELLPKTTLITQAQFKLNELGENCTVINAAGGSTFGEVQAKDLIDGNGSVSQNDDGGTVVPCLPGDYILEKLDKVTLLKIDVEGYELQVLKGCRKILNSIPMIALELHLDQLRSFGASIEEIWTMLPMDQYEGSYLHNPGTAYIRPDSHKITKLNHLDEFPTAGIVNLFLFPKSAQAK
jgi:FkbM family methyltransferase